MKANFEIHIMALQEKKNEDTPLKIPGPHPLVYHLSALFLPFAILTTLFFIIFKQIVRIYLLFKHGQNFGGFFHLGDTIWFVNEKNCSNIVPVLLVVKSKEKIDIVKKIKTRLRDRIFETKDYPKLTSTCHFCCGYPYLILDQYKLEECVHALKNPEFNQQFDEDYLCQVVSESGTTDFQKKEALWEIFLTNRHFELNSDEKEYKYPVYLKIHHAVGDGVSMVTFIMKLFGDSNTEQYMEKVVKKYLENARKNTVKADFKTQLVNFKNVILHYLYLLYIELGRLFWLLFLREKDKSVLHGPTLSGEKIAVVSWEQHQELVPLVKKIKNRIPNCKFSDVLYTALSVSVTNFYKRNGYPVPKQLSTMVPIILSYREMTKPGPVKLFNKFTVTFLDLPTQKDNLCDTLEKVKYQHWLMTNLPDTEINYWLLNYIFTVIPIPILKFTLKLEGFTQGVSVLPGTAKTKFLDGCDMANVISFPPHIWKTGLGVMCVTYDDKLQIGLIVDKALISARDEAQKIADDIFENIREIDKEMSSFYGE